MSTTRYEIDGRFSRWQAVARDLLIESAMRLRTLRPKTPNPTWPLDERRLADITLGWPRAYQWPPAKKWMDSLIYALRRLVRVNTIDLEQSYAGIVVFVLSISGHSHYVAIDYSDYQVVNDACVKKCVVYFKMQFARDGYPYDNILPGGFVPWENDLYTFLDHVRRIRDEQQFTFDVYGRFSLHFATDVRMKAFDLLCNQDQFRYEGSAKLIRYSRYLREIARSKVCINVPGNGDLCFRLIDYLGVGACVIGPRPRTRLHVELVDRRHIVYARDDLADLTELCKQYLQDERAREQVCKESRLFFDRHLHRSQLARYYLQSCLDRLA